MKKISLLCMLLSISLLAACGTENNPSSPSATETPANPATPTTTNQPEENNGQQVSAFLEVASIELTGHPSATVLDWI
ncbi:hypothetical protein T458_24135 [Brevibacillus panacihumi W25]|uniref:Uncharacterized protein n=1 Tax=Brevibacillus panacihumi W25 TaxID=1408254 RepID=V6M2P4_9BACL|nr:hypothetical protein [Brevibacillus panacihumi]EST52155.1 hypothetical protein T458_24135 [Brevibacillus panacihumi W25]